MSPNRILIVRLGALGDIVHAIPVAAALRRAFPGAGIDWLVSARHRKILDLVPIIDQRLVINSAADAARTIAELRRARYDVAIDLQGLVKSAALARLSGARRVVGFATSYLRERLARPFYTDVYDPGCGGIYDPRETRHVVADQPRPAAGPGRGCRRAGVSPRTLSNPPSLRRCESRPAAVTRS